MGSTLVRAVTVLIAVISLMSHADVYASVKYAMTDLGSFEGNHSTALGINNFGQIVGASLGADGLSHAFFWDSVYGIQMLPGLGDASVAFDINSQGYAVGYAYLSTPNLDNGRAVVWPNVATVQQFAGHGQLNSANAVAINDQGVVVGDWFDETNVNRSVRWDGSDMLELGRFPGSDYIESRTKDINNAGQIVGGAYTNTDEYTSVFHAYVWTLPSGMVDIGTLGGRLSNAYGINNQGVVVGGSSLRNGDETHAFVWLPDVLNGVAGTMIDLGTLGGSQSVANAINNSGAIVGGSHMPGDVVAHAFLYDGRQMLDLNQLVALPSGWIIESVNDINDLGQIVGYAKVNGQYSRAILLTPVPEPSVICLLVIGVPSAFRRSSCRLPEVC
ncbi:MAG: DUF3466 family protein [Phycisphaeraceae bacterium]|nr:DUF3466 family protein [Phycisphaeraceae bacterium]